MSIVYARLYARLHTRMFARLQARLRLFGRLLVPVGTLVAIALAESAGRRWMP
jgi:uncharacterized protein YjeT (DUF2065 family)